MGFSHQFSRQLHRYITDPNRSAQPMAMDEKLQAVYQRLQQAQTQPKAYQNQQLRDLFKDVGITSSADQQAIGRRLAFAEAETHAKGPMAFIQEFNQMLNTKVSDLVRTEHQAKLEHMVTESREALGTIQTRVDFDSSTQEFLRSYRNPLADDYSAEPSQMLGPSGTPTEDDLMAMLANQNPPTGVGQSP
jgi:hypothetical protein